MAEKELQIAQFISHIEEEYPIFRRFRHLPFAIRKLQFGYSCRQAIF
jgi:hypothetical protein